jgi:tRNA pseudouridine55 synthase
MSYPYIIDKRFDGNISLNFSQYSDGILIPIDKPYRWTSSDVVRKVKFALQKHFKMRNLKVGHAGTLDPLATGMLIICAGKATKLAETLQAHTKEYIATIEFGATTPSYDLETDIDTHYPYEHITRELIESKLPQFIGTQEQVAPLFSAKMVNGVRAYELARAGESVELKASTITIEEIEILDFGYIDRDSSLESNNNSGQNERAFINSPISRGSGPSIKLRIRCSKGTYIRSIARDLGLAVGSGGHLTSLQRTISGDFQINNAISLEKLISICNFAS